MNTGCSRQIATATSFFRGSRRSSISFVTIINYQETMNQTFVLSVLFVIFGIATAQSPCTFKNTRTKTGFALSCECPTGKATIPIDASVDVTATCLETCLDRVQEFCDSRGSRFFRTKALEARDLCCSECGGRFEDNVCQRIYLEGRPLVIPPSEGCFYKVRGTTLGHNYACRCADGKNFEVPFFLATGVDEDCTSMCGVNALEKKCKITKTEEKMTKKFGKSFDKCCQSCGGKPIISRTGLKTCSSKK